MAERPSCIVNAETVGASDRSPHQGADRVGYRVRRLSDAVGLTQMGVALREVPAGRVGTHLHYHEIEEEWVESTTFLTHESTDEWVFLLSGTAEVRIGDDRHRVGEGDFIAHPARGPAHVMRALTDVTYLMGGEHISNDVVIYPEIGMRLTSAGFEKILP